jgi:hypothetical protein
MAPSGGLGRLRLISPSRPAYVIILVDQSAAMEGIAAIGALTASRAALAAESANRALLALLSISARADGTAAPCFDISVLLHGGPEGLRSALEGGLGADRVVGLAALRAQAGRLEWRRRRGSGADGGSRDRVEFPVWVTPSAFGEAHVDEALEEAGRLARRWSRRHPGRSDPILLTIGGGAMALAARPPANLIVIHSLLNDEPGGPVVFPADPAELAGDEDALRLFDLASPVPFARRAASAPLARGARGLLRNADVAEGLERLLSGAVRAPSGGFLAWLGLARRPPSRPVTEILWGDALGGDGAPASAQPMSPPIGRAEDARFDVRWVLAPKDGARPRDCEDAVGHNLATGRFCVTDGAGEGVYSRLWARTLANGWRNVGSSDQDDVALREGLKGLDGVLRQRIGRLRQRIQDRQGGRLFWFQSDDRIAEFAAFVGLAFDDDGSWRALAVGDACVFIEQGDGMVSFPLVRPEDFQGGAYLVPSAIDDDAGLVDHVCRADGRRLVGDRFLLMSDAMACWYLSYPGRRSRLRDLLERRDRPGLGALIARERRARRLRNDDIAVLSIRIKSRL